MNPPPDKNRRVLVIDDHRAIHDDFRKILAPAIPRTGTLNATEAALWGYTKEEIPQTRFEIDSAYQGQEGLLLVKQALETGQPYAMAFVDIRMPPGWDGVETTRKIWELDPDLQIVLCTAYSDYSWAELVEKLGQQNGLLILKKPFDAVEALQLACALTEKWGLSQEARQKMEALESRVAERTQDLATSLSLLHATLESTADGVVAVDRAGKIVSYNTRFAATWQFPAGMLDRRNAVETRAHTAQQLKDPAGFLQGLKELQANPEAETFDVIELKDGRIFERYAFPQRIEGECVGSVFNWRDITESKRLESQLFQFQKMESVGRLAGSIAHEFNSLLTAIIGQSELLLAGLPAGSPLAANTTQIRQAADRAATLTQQLLAYGRKQFLRPEALNLNRILAGMNGVLRQLMVAEMLDVTIVTADPLHWVEADAGQIEQVIMNLAMNARDAMPNGGKLTVETANVSFGPESVRQYPELKPGHYVMLAITDTGTGIREDLKARVFEPFFTTKGMGQGSGLGLSTCYGIIKQSGGHLTFSSEPGQGTTFKIYLPRIEQPTKVPPRGADTTDLPSGTGSILLVEEDDALREMAATLLRRLGYTVLAAANGTDALNLEGSPDSGHFDLLLTSVALPDMRGHELADRVRALYPNVCILFTSANAENAFLRQGVLESGAPRLQKPFTPSALAHKVGEVLDQAPSPQRTSKAGGSFKDPSQQEHH